MLLNLTKRIERVAERVVCNVVEKLRISQRELKATFSIIRIRAAGLKESHKENLMVRCFWVVILRRGVIAFKIF